MNLNIKVNYYDIVDLLIKATDTQRIDIIKYIILQSRSRTFCKKLKKEIMEFEKTL